MIHWFIDVKVEHRPNVPMVARSGGIGPWKKIILGAYWNNLSLNEQTAVLYHEREHCRRFHMEKRLLALPFCWLGAVQRWARRQELECDAAAAEAGFGYEMQRVIGKFEPNHNEFYPTHRERIENLFLHMQREARNHA